MLSVTIGNYHSAGVGDIPVVVGVSTALRTAGAGKGGVVTACVHNNGLSLRRSSHIDISKVGAITRIKRKQLGASER